MLTGEIRNKVDKIWTDIWAGGITNPLTVIEQLTYLMFIRSLDEKELENESMEALTGEPMPKIFPQDEDGQALRWSRFKTKDARLIYDIVGTKVFPFIKEMNGNNNSSFSRYMQDAMFLIPTPQDKTHFLIFDYLRNFDFFRAHKDGLQGSEGQSLSEAIFAKRVRLIHHLQHSAFIDRPYQKIRSGLVGTVLQQVNALNPVLISVRLKLQYVEKYKRPEAFDYLSDLDQRELMVHLAPLVYMDETDEYAKRFDNFMYGLMIAQIEGGPQFKNS